MSDSREQTEGHDLKILRARGNKSDSVHVYERRALVKQLLGNAMFRDVSALAKKSILLELDKMGCSTSMRTLDRDIAAIKKKHSGMILAQKNYHKSVELGSKYLKMTDLECEKTLALPAQKIVIRESFLPGGKTVIIKTILAPDNAYFAYRQLDALKIKLAVTKSMINILNNGKIDVSISSMSMAFNRAKEKNEKLKAQIDEFKEKETVDKICQLVNLDFSWIYHYKKNLEETQKTLKASMDEGLISRFAQNIDSLRDLMEKLQTDFKFFNWDALENSDSLTKLKPAEARQLRYTHDEILKVDSDIKKACMELGVTLEDSLNIIDMEDRSEFFKNEVDKYFEKILAGYSIIDTAFDKLKIKWIDLDFFPKAQSKRKTNSVSETAQ